LRIPRDRIRFVRDFQKHTWTLQTAGLLCVTSGEFASTQGYLLQRKAPNSTYHSPVCRPRRVRPILGEDPYSLIAATSKPQLLLVPLAGRRPVREGHCDAENACVFRSGGVIPAFCRQNFGYPVIPLGDRCFSFHGWARMEEALWRMVASSVLGRGGCS